MRKGLITMLALAGLLAAGAAWAHEGHDDGDKDDMKGMDMKGMSKHDMKDMDKKADADDKDDDKEAPAKTVTLKGEVLDMDCYMNEGASGKEHQSCAIMCLKNGGPVGLLAEDGKAYFLTGNEDKGKMKFYDSVREWGGAKVKITGVIQNRGGALCLRIDGAEKL